MRPTATPFVPIRLRLRTSRYVPLYPFSCPLPLVLSHDQAADLGWLSFSGKGFERCGCRLASESEPFRHAVAWRVGASTPRAWAASCTNLGSQLPGLCRVRPVRGAI